VKKKRSGRETYDYVFVWKRKRKKRMRGGKSGRVGPLTIPIPPQDDTS
jgi:hypothetical protein